MSRCARSFRTRAVRLVAPLAIGSMATLPLLAADPAAAATPRVEFSGDGAELLSCDSRPSTPELTVPAESTVIFVNKLDDDATLRINGRESARVDEDESVEVLFHRGTVRVAMVPDCGLSLSNTVQSVTVTVGAAGSASHTSSAGSGKSAKPSPTDSSAARSRHGSRSTVSDRLASPGQSSPAAPSGAPAAAGDASPGAGAGQGEVADGDEAVAAEPVSTDATTEEDGPNGLLAIIAVICVVGVSAGAIRAIAAQRATRTSAA